jgi:hypothetical protein
MNVASRDKMLSEFKQLGYTDEELTKLAEASKWYDPMQNITLEEACTSLQEAMDKYKKISE